jgi:hypothetical protein
MAIHKQILEWQAAHPNITWIGWGIVWAIVLVTLFWLELWADKSRWPPERRRTFLEYCS